MHFNCQERSVKKLTAIASLIRPGNSESKTASEHHSWEIEAAEKVPKVVQMGDTETQP
jgi:hypothetical protein